LRVIGEVAAGMASPPAVAAGTTVRIMTGAPIPPGADAVVPVEAASEETDDHVDLAAAQRGAHVRNAAHDTRAGDDVTVAGARPDPTEGRRARFPGDRLGHRPSATGRRHPVDRR
jgi:molybdopterin molybdotransferase